MIKAEELKKYMDFAFEAYHSHNTSGQEYRQKGKVPYIMHPIWCASIFITDTRIPYKEREIGFKALILHDVLEDTDLPLPNWVELKVKNIVKELTFESPNQALREAESKSIFIKLLLLVDGLSSMYEEHVAPQRKKIWKKAMKKLLKDVKAKYGNIRIVQVAEVVIKNTDW